MKKMKMSMPKMPATKARGTPPSPTGAHGDQRDQAITTALKKAHSLRKMLGRRKGRV